MKELEKLSHAKKIDSAGAFVDELIRGAETINNTKVIAKLTQDLDIAGLRNAVDLIKRQSASCVIALAADNAGTASLVIGLTPDLCDKGLDASRLIAQVAGLISGSGGGRKDFAQAGGNNPANLPKVFEEIKKTIADLK